MDYLLNRKLNPVQRIYRQLVLNLIINGLPSKPEANIKHMEREDSFKPYYKWITF